MDDVCELSLILPAYNEEAGIARSVIEADEALARLGISYEIIVVDDGSDDRTAANISRLQADRSKVRLVRHELNQGYGAALRTGFAAARGERIAFTDADCQFHLDDLALLLPLTEQNPIAAGYRIDRKDTFLRKFYSRSYNLLARTLLGTPVRDIDCALKVFRRDALQRILPETHGFFVNTEMLSRARQLHLKIAEVGVRHRPREHGTSKVSLGDVPRVLNALLPFWWMTVMFPASRRVYPGGPAAVNKLHRCPLEVILMLLLLAMASILFLARLDHPLLEPEEARYAEIPRQMLAEGRVLTPVLHGEDYWQKPPLLYWLVMLSYQIFGVHDWSARLISCLAGILCVGSTAAWAWRTLGFWTGLVSGVMLTLSARVLYLAGMLSMDSPLCACVVAGLAAGHLAMTEERLRMRWSMLAVFACALGILLKGPVALVLIGAPLIALAFLDRRCRFWSLRESGCYLGLIALLAGPWFVVMAWSAPEAAESFFWLHNLMRYVAPIDHEKPAWFYVPSLLLGMLPWTLLAVPLAPYLLRRSLRTGKRRPPALGVFVLAFGWCVLFFSFSGCKRQGYILPAFPLFALILGTFVTHGLPWRQWMQAASSVAQHSSRRWARRLTFAACTLAVTCSAAAAFAQLWPWEHAVFLSVAFVILSAAALLPPVRLPAWTSWAGCVSIMFFFLVIGQRAFLPDYHDRFGLRRQVGISSEYEQEEDLPILTYPKRWDSVSFYSRRDNVESYSPVELEMLVRDLQAHGKAMVFVRRTGALRELLEALPREMEFVPLGRQADYVAVGIVRRREK